MGKREIRWNRMVELVHDRGFIPIRELAQTLGVSEMTVRRDLAAVEQGGRVKNVNGVLVSSVNRGLACLEKKYDLEEETQVENEAKVLIGRRAAAMIQPGDCIILDVGTTTEQIAAQLPEELELEALCFTMNILRRLCGKPRVQVALAGGYYRPRTQLFVSEEGIDFVRGVRANRMFLSAAGVREDLGISCVNSYEVALKRAALRSAQQHSLVADSKKFGVVRPAYVCDLTDIDAVITDTGLSPEWAERIRAKGIELYQV